MDDVTEANAAAVQTAEHAGALEKVETAEHAEAVQTAEHDEAEAPAKEPEPESPHLVTLDDYCIAKSKKLHGHIELISAFNTLETRKHNLLDTTANFDAAFDALCARVAK